MKLKHRIAKILAIPAIALASVAGVGIFAAPAGAAQYEPTNTWIQQGGPANNNGWVNLETYYGNYYVGFSQVYMSYANACGVCWGSTEAINGYGQTNGWANGPADQTGSGTAVTSTVPAGGIYYGVFNINVSGFGAQDSWTYVI